MPPLREPPAAANSQKTRDIVQFIEKACQNRHGNLYAIRRKARDKAIWKQRAIVVGKETLNTICRNHLKQTYTLMSDIIPPRPEEYKTQYMQEVAKLLMDVSGNLKQRGFLQSKNILSTGLEKLRETSQLMRYVNNG